MDGMLILTKSVMAMMIGFILAVLLGIIIIPVLKRLHAGQTISKWLARTHKNKQGTPTMGGLIFIIPPVLVMFILILMGKAEFNYTLGIVLFTFIGYFIIGFIDDFLIIKRHNNKGLTKTQKFSMQVVVAIIFFYLFMKGENEPLLWVHCLHFKMNIGWLYGVFILFVLVASSNAVNLTDGLDGLAGGLSVIAFLTFGIISWNTDWLLGYSEISLFAFILVGSLMGFLIFNTNKAKVFMGDTGSLCLGATLGAYAIMTRHELLLVLIGIVFVIETLSCMIQIVFFKLTGKRVFPMTPIHHTFEKIGMKEADIVKMFWTVGLIAAMLALVYGVWL